MRILIVEDEELIAQSLRDGLMADGYAVDHAATGPDGLWHATEHRYDAIVLDVLLPELAGLLYDDGAEQGAGHRVWRLLDHVDHRTQEHGPLDDTVLWTLLLLEPMKEASEGADEAAEKKPAKKVAKKDDAAADGAE